MDYHLNSDLKLCFLLFFISHCYRTMNLNFAELTKYLFFRQAGMASIEDEPSSSAGCSEPEIKDEPDAKTPRTHSTNNSPRTHSTNNSCVKTTDIAPKCENHPEADCTFWCSNCVIAICLQCVSDTHKQHNFQFLQTVLKQKVKDSLERLEFLKTGIRKVDFNITQCLDETEFNNRCIEKTKKRIVNCEQLRSIPGYYEEHIEPFWKFANGEERIAIDAKVLADLLKLLHQTDTDFFRMKPSTLIAAFTGAFATPLFPSGCSIFSKDITAHMVEFKITGNEINGEPKFEVSCTHNNLTWPLTIDLKITVITRQCYKQVTRYYFDELFPDVSTKRYYVFPMCKTDQCEMVFELSIH